MPRSKKKTSNQLWITNGRCTFHQTRHSFFQCTIKISAIFFSTTAFNRTSTIQVMFSTNYTIFGYFLVSGFPNGKNIIKPPGGWINCFPKAIRSWRLALAFLRDSHGKGSAGTVLKKMPWRSTWMWSIGDLGGGNFRGKNDRKFISEND